MIVFMYILVFVTVVKLFFDLSYLSRAIHTCEKEKDYMLFLDHEFIFMKKIGFTSILIIICMMVQSTF